MVANLRIGTRNVDHYPSSPWTSVKQSKIANTPFLVVNGITDLRSKLSNVPGDSVMVAVLPHLTALPTVPTRRPSIYPGLPCIPEISTDDLKTYYIVSSTAGYQHSQCPQPIQNGRRFCKPWGARGQLLEQDANWASAAYGSFLSLLRVKVEWGYAGRICDQQQPLVVLSYTTYMKVFNWANRQVETSQ